MSQKRSITDLKDLSRLESVNHFKVQQEISTQQATRGGEASNAIVDFLTTKVWGWIKHYVKSRFMGKVAYRAYPIEGDTGIFQLHNAAKSGGAITLAIASDWASNTQESDDIGTLMGAENADYTVHLGDVYYVGTPQEVLENFGPGGSWPKGNVGTLSVPGNHEFYSNGAGFYEDLLPQMSAYKDATASAQTTQKASFFCLENEHWRIVALDTGYTSVGTPLVEFVVPPKAELPDEQYDWLRDTLKLGDPTDTRGLILMSHHQYYSAFEGEYPAAAVQIAELMGNAKRDVLWYWGHEHRIAIHDIHKLEGGLWAYGRCIGHGGMPTDIPTAEHPLDVQQAREAQLRYYDREYRVVKDKDKKVFIGNNGYVKMILEGDKIRVEHYQSRYDNDNKVSKILVLTEYISKDPKGNINVGYTPNPNDIVLVAF